MTTVQGKFIKIRKENPVGYVWLTLWLGVANSPLYLLHQSIIPNQNRSQRNFVGCLFFCHNWLQYGRVLIGIFWMARMCFVQNALLGIEIVSQGRNLCVWNNCFVKHSYKPCAGIKSWAPVPLVNAHFPWWLDLLALCLSSVFLSFKHLCRDAPLMRKSSLSLLHVPYKDLEQVLLRLWSSFQASAPASIIRK